MTRNEIIKLSDKIVLATFNDDPDSHLWHKQNAINYMLAMVKSDTSKNDMLGDLDVIKNIVRSSDDIVEDCGIFDGNFKPISRKNVIKDYGSEY